jgi:C1A family cysteine protease
VESDPRPGIEPIPGKFRHAPDLTPDDFPGPRPKRKRSDGRQPRHPARHHTGQARHRLRTHFGGWIRSVPDPLRLIADTFGIPLRTEVDPRSQMPPVFDQGQVGACTANATAAAFQYDASLDGNLTGPLSRLWIYYQERRLEGSLSDGDAGARGSDAFKVAQHVGIPAETYWPYDISTYQGPPPEAAVRDENFYRLTKPYATPPLTRHSFKQIFSNQQTIAFGFVVYESFESSAVARTGVVPMPKRGEAILGGHEVLAIGYLKSAPDYVLVRNSWGSRKLGSRGWGLNGSGYFLMPWRMILDPDLCGDWTTIVRPIARR